MSTKNMTPPAEFDNIQVIAIPEIDSLGKTKYKTTFIPESVEITSHDTVLNYQLISPTPEGVKFSGVSIKPEHNDQLSVPSISCSGKMVTFSDANTVRETISLTFHFIDDEGVEFFVDPDIDNVPPPTAPQE